jgi:mannose-6-phosphate isomerase-like protein (cupin superfamily)
MQGDSNGRAHQPYCGTCEAEEAARSHIKSSGKTAWERHPDDEELVQIVDGTATFDLITDDGSPQSFDVSAGTIAIVPKGV